MSVSGAAGPPAVKPPPVPKPPDTMDEMPVVDAAGPTVSKRSPATPAHKSAAAAPTQADPAASTTDMITSALLKRGRELLMAGDISGARLAYQRAADSGSGQAALAMGKTYDPNFLRETGVRGIHADPKKAMEWYAKAAALGEREAAGRSVRLEHPHAG
jgi:hypothetical protein